MKPTSAGTTPSAARSAKASRCAVLRPTSKTIRTRKLKQNYPKPNSSSQYVPARWRREVERVLVTEGQIASRVRQLARQIERDFRGRELVVVSLLNGTVMFLADLLRHIAIPLRLDFIGVTSYGSGTESSELVVTKELRLDVRGRDVLVVDDILDTGKTLSYILPKLRALRPRCIRVCVLLDKPSRRIEDIQADYVGFPIPDYFVVGYGLDFAERYRNLPFIGVLYPRIYKKVCKDVVASRSQKPVRMT